MISKKLTHTILILLFSISLLKSQEITNAPSPLSESITEMTSKIRLAKDYYMNSQDEDAGKTFEQRTAKLSERIKFLFKDFKDKRAEQYRNVGITLSGSDWATAHHATKTETIPSNIYIFTKIERTRNGDWKGGPIINGADRYNWSEGDIPGGSVTWVTGGHGKAQTYWRITAKYTTDHISNKINDEQKTIKQSLYAVNLPAD